MIHIYIDEAGITTPFRSSEWFLVIVALCLERPTVRSIELHMKRLRKKLGRHAGNELKASTATHNQVRQLLESIASEDFEVATVVLDKRDVVKMPRDPENWYREALSEVVLNCAKRHPRCSLVLDARYTKRALREKLEAEIMSRIGDLANATISIRHQDSRKSLVLQATDYVAWAVRRKYEAQEEQYYRIIEGKIISEIVIRAM